MTANSRAMGHAGLRFFGPEANLTLIFIAIFLVFNLKIAV